jgi:5-formyltetrahydrofolate cyclo-ligase
VICMTVDRQLLRRILEHYKHRLDEFLQDEKIKPLASGHLAKHITDLKREVDTALAALTSLQSDLDTEIRNWVRVHADVLRPAVAQYKKDAKQLLEEAREKLSEPNLRELEIELARIAAEIATLLNL